MLGGILFHVFISVSVSSLVNQNVDHDFFVSISLRILVQITTTRMIYSLSITLISQEQNAVC